LVLDTNLLSWKHLWENVCSSLFEVESFFEVRTQRLSIRLVYLSKVVLGRGREREREALKGCLERVFLKVAGLEMAFFFTFVCP